MMPTVGPYQAMNAVLMPSPPKPNPAALPFSMPSSAPYASMPAAVPFLDPDAGLRRQLKHTTLGAASDTQPDPILLDGGLMDQYFNLVITGNLDAAQAVMEQIQRERPDMFAAMAQGLGNVPGAMALQAGPQPYAKAFSPSVDPRLSTALQAHQMVMQRVAARNAMQATMPPSSFYTGGPPAAYSLANNSMIRSA